MPAKLMVKFTFDKHLGFPPPVVRIWIDKNGDFVPDHTEEVTLDNTGLTWEGSFDLSTPTSAGVWYLVAFAGGSVGAKYTVEVRSDSPTDHAVGVGRGTVKSLRHSFWGLCSA